MSELKPCPCGKTPETLIITESEQPYRWARSYGNCCGEWEQEFRTYNHSLNSPECMEYAVAAWNEAPRDTRITELEAKLVEAEAENELLRGGIREAMDWNWLDDMEHIPREVVHSLEKLSLPPATEGEIGE